MKRWILLLLLCAGCQTPPAEPPDDGPVGTNGYPGAGTYDDDLTAGSGEEYGQ